jgi:hypothetical protein
MAAPGWPGADPRPPYHREPEPRPGSYRRDRSRAGGGRGRRESPRRAARWWGTRPGRLGVSIVIFSAAVGMIGTIAARSEPGPVLGAFVAAGTVAAALAVRPRAVHVIIPVPALAYLVAASIAGMIHDRAADTSRTALLTSATQWFAGGFLAIVGATAAAIVITAVRRPRSRRGPGHRSPRPPLSRG